jgi:hypothetical protein
MSSLVAFNLVDYRSESWFLGEVPPLQTRIHSSMISRLHVKIISRKNQSNVLRRFHTGVYESVASFLNCSPDSYIPVVMRQGDSVCSIRSDGHSTKHCHVLRAGLLVLNQNFCSPGGIDFCSKTKIQLRGNKPTLYAQPLHTLIRSGMHFRRWVITMDSQTDSGNW